MKRLAKVLIVSVIVLGAVPVSGQQRGRSNGDNSSHRPGNTQSDGRGGNPPHRAIGGGSSHRGGTVIIHSNPVPRPVVIVRSPAPRHRPVVRPSWGYNSYSYGYSGANYYVRNEVVEPPYTSSCYVPAGAELDELNAMARNIKAGREAKQLNALDELAQEGRELEMKAAELRMKAENQKFKDELKKLEAPAPVRK